MPTTGVVNGRLTLFRINTTSTNYLAAGCATECTLTIEVETRETTCAQSGDFRTYLPGLISGSGSFSGLVAFDDANYAPDDLGTWILAPAVKLCKFDSAVSGDPSWAGSVILTNVTFQSGQNGQNMTYSGSIQFTGTITQGTVA
jgi:hypothetical protein